MVLLRVDRAKEEAEACLNVINDFNPDYPIYFDIEDKSQISGLTTRTRTDMVIAFCEKIREAGYKAGVYANPNWFNNFLYKNELINEYEIWLAHWTDDPDTPSRYNYNQKVWQWGLDQIADYNVDGDLSFFDYSEAKSKDDNAPEVPAPVLPIEIGDTIYFKGGPHYGASTSPKAVGGVRSAGLAVVQSIAPNAPHKYALKGVPGGSNVYGWVDADLVEPCETAEEIATSLALGDRVKIKKGAKTYKGGNLANFVYSNIYSVMQIGSGVAPDYIVIGTGGAVTAALHAADLIRV